MRPHACVAALAIVNAYLPPLPARHRLTRRPAAVDEPQQTRKEFTVPKAASTRETEVRAVTAATRDGNVSLREVFVGNDGSSRQLYDNGVVIFNYEWTAALVLILFAIFILPSFLRAKISTVPMFLEERYDVRSRRAFSLFTILAIMFIDTAGALYAGGLVISNVTAVLNLWTAVAVLALVAAELARVV